MKMNSKYTCFLNVFLIIFRVFEKIAWILLDCHLSLFDLAVNLNVGATKAFRKSFTGHPQASLPENLRVTARSTKFRKEAIQICVCWCSLR